MAEGKGDVVWLDVLPSMATFATTLAKGTAKAATDAGKSSGVAWAKSFSGSAGDAGTKTVVAELETASKRTKRIVDDQTAAIGRARAAQKDAAAKVVLAEQALADARSKGDTSKAEAAELRLGAARDRLDSAAAKLVSAEDQLKAAHREHRTVVDQLEQATSELSSETTSSASAVDKAKGSWEGAGKSVGVMVAGLAAATGAVALFSEAWSGVVGAEASTDLLTVQLGLSEAQAQQAGEAAGSLYAQAYGDSLGEVSSAVGTVLSSIGSLRDASTDDIEEISKYALNLSTIFGVDVAESTRNVGVWLNTGLVDDAKEGMDLLQQTLQFVPESLRGEVIDAGHEYATFFSQLGLNGEQAMALLSEASMDGQYAIDKMGDALKELTIRSTDMSKTSTAAYEAAGLSAEDMAARFLAGGDEASGALSDLVAGLQGIDDPVERANAAIALFGTPLEDLGTDQIPAFLDTLGGIDGAFLDVEGAAAAADETLNDNFATNLETLKRGFMSTLQDGIEPLLGPASAVLDWLQTTEGALPAVGIALGVLATAWTIYTVAQWAANSAMLASPLTWIIVGVAALAAGIVLAVQHWGEITDWIREKWEPIGDWFAGIWETISSAVGTAWDWITEKLGAAWDFIWDYVLLPWRIQFEVAKTVLEWVVNAVVVAWNWMSDALAAGWEWIDDHVITPIRAGIALVGAAFEWWRDTAVSAWETIRSGISSAWDWIDDHVFTPIKAGIDAVGRAFDATATWIGEAWERVKEAAAAPVRFVVNTIYRDGIKATWDRIADAVGLDLHLPTITLPFADGGVMPGYTPGRDVHRFYSPTGGLLELSGGEPILRPEAGRVLGTDWVHGINAAARTGGTAGVESFLGGGQGFADGGFWDQVGGVVSSIGQGVRGVVVNVARILSDPVNAVRDMLTAPIDRLLSQVGGGVLGQILVEYPRSVIEGIVTKARDLISGLTGGGGEYSGAAGAWVRPAQGPVTSEYGPRNGAFHAGIDIGGPGPTFAAAAGSVVRTGWGVLAGRTGLGILLSHGDGDYTYYGHNPVGGIKVNTGDVVAPGQAIGAKGHTGNATGDHLHFELHRGGLGHTVNPRSAGVFDNGGYLPTGVSVVENRSGEPEPVLTGEQWDALANQAAVARIAGEDMDAFAERVARAVVEAASQEAGRQLSSVRRDYQGRSKTPGALR